MEQIKFILERFFHACKMNAFVYDRDNRLMDFCMEDGEKIREEFLISIREKCKSTDSPVICMEQDGIYYLAFQNNVEQLFVFGPASVVALSFAQHIAYRKRHGITNQKYVVPQVSYAQSLNTLSMVYYMATGQIVTEQEILIQSQLQKDYKVAFPEMTVYEIQNTTEEKQHLAYQDEVRWTMDIENGILEKKEKRMTPENLEKMERIGTLAGSNSLKQFEYMAVTSCCLASRAAIRGGMNAYDAYRTSEMFLQKISKCTNFMEILQVHMEITETFTSQVRLAKENRSFDCVEQCKDYIARHRTKKFSLKDVAEAVGKNPNYLSRVFSEQTGTTMQDYALNVRLEAAANILKFSNEDIGEIAEYLNFPSQSYFGERFKKKYGVTPGNYRKHNKIRDFKE